MSLDKNVDVGLNIWLKSGKETVFCQGRALLLERIREHGSLRQAAKSLRMSYRAAWGKLKQTHDVLGYELIALSGSGPKRYRLTRRGQEILEAYWSWRKKVEAQAVREAEGLRRLFDPADGK